MSDFTSGYLMGRIFEGMDKDRSERSLKQTHYGELNAMQNELNRLNMLVSHKGESLNLKDQFLDQKDQYIKEINSVLEKAKALLAKHKKEHFQALVEKEAEKAENDFNRFMQAAHFIHRTLYPRPERRGFTVR